MTSKIGNVYQVDEKTIGAVIREFDGGVLAIRYVESSSAHRQIYEQTGFDTGVENLPLVGFVVQLTKDYQEVKEELDKFKYDLTLYDNLEAFYKDDDRSELVKSIGIFREDTKLKIQLSREKIKLMIERNWGVTYEQLY